MRAPAARWCPYSLQEITNAVFLHSGLFIDEALVTVRGPGQGVSLHSGGHKRRVRTQYRVATGGADGVSDLEWRVGQLNVMMALTDVGPGDGATMVIPGSSP